MSRTRRGRVGRLGVAARGGRGRSMSPRQALAFVRKHGVVLESAEGPVPSLAAAIAGETIRGSWWAHPRGHEIFEITRAVRDSREVLVCRLVAGKITYVHRRLWPALVKLADHLPRERLAQVRELHTASGRHVTEEIAFPRWVPRAITGEASRLSEAAAASIRSVLPRSTLRTPDRRCRREPDSH
jgi:hypothetical protein